MAHKPSLTSQLLHAAIDLTRQAVKDPAVKDAATRGLKHVGRELAHKAETALRKRAHRVTLPAAQPVDAPPRRAGVLAEVMNRASAFRAHGTPGLADEIIGEATATYQRVYGEYAGLIADAKAAAEAETPAATEMLADGAPAELADTPAAVPEREPRPYRLTGPIDRIALGGAETFSAATSPRPTPRPRADAELDGTEARAELAENLAETVAGGRAELEDTAMPAELEDTEVRGKAVTPARD